MQSIDALEAQALAEIEKAGSTDELKELESKYLGKSGLFPALFKTIGEIPPAEKPLFGQKLNEARKRVEERLAARADALKRGERTIQFDREKIDFTMPSRPMRIGNKHVLQQAVDKIKEVLVGLGFQYFEGPELEEFRYNFTALNYPPDHPAMDEQDTFYIDENRLLRTQGTAIQGRVFETHQPPLRFFTVGRTFRNEAVDRTHSHTFHQVDAFMIDEGISMADLKGTLGAFVRSLLGEDVKVRFRPDFFPFVEPGVDYAISTPKLFNGRWVELGGAGLIHPNILENYGFDPERWSGFAFGLGVERIPMMAYGVDDLRHFLENDLRFLGQFPG